ncbi:MAG: hypothetical protein GF383_14235 [Candidatus Lokiarchaeota archaeon]|nr:hypothetical protein [Candidatus Lokiarchaeota archaeon]MBD3342515.1 hypothetical protein [Candidatus Lokiarchaeota archaeon]
MTEAYQDHIGLLTDFGLKGQHYVASMKGVILQLNPNATIVDISHNVSSYSILEAAYLMNSTYKYFPECTVFVIVVDPGVGSSREIIALKTIKNYYFVGPNNGLFPHIISKDKISDCVKVENDNYFNKPVSRTFHGRDIMGPVGAHITLGVPLTNFGNSFDINNLVSLPIDLRINEEKKKILCTVQYIDNFGNVTTNVRLIGNSVEGYDLELPLDCMLKFKINNRQISAKFVTHFSGVQRNKYLFLRGSSNFLELSKNQANAAKDLDLKVGDTIEINLA